MSRKLTVEFSDEVYNFIQHQAEESNLTPAQVVSTSVEKSFQEQHANDPDSGAPRRIRRPGARGKAELQMARERFERHFGAVDLGHPTGADNEGIDADLEREYAGVIKPA